VIKIVSQLVAKLAGFLRNTLLEIAGKKKKSTGNL
jgi:hypothetical protein